jgi:hypothetical protein
MDHRGRVPFGDHWLTFGGMLENQEVTGQVLAYEMELGGGCLTRLTGDGAL